MSRGLISGLPSPHPLGSYLPDVFLQEGIAERVAATSAFPLGTYTTSITERDLRVADADESVSLEGLAGYWVLDVTRDPDAQEGPLRVTLFRDGSSVATGTLVSSGRRATLITSNCGTEESIYEWSFAGDSLRLHPVEDPCASRMLVLSTHEWLRESFVIRLMSAFDDALAPVFSSLDNIDAYVDPRLAPADFVDWLSGWVALSRDHGWRLRRRRDRVAGEIQLAKSWGTPDGIKDVVSIFAGVARDDVEVDESGGVAASPTPGGKLPGAPTPQLTVRVRVPEPSNVDAARLERVVAAAKPAHVPHEVEVLGT
jgi:phage tail-like protein